jgi:hypothetical protein
MLAGIAVLTTVDSVAGATEAVAAGAALVDVGADEALVARIRHAGLDLLVCGPGPAADLSRYGPAEALQAVRQGVPRERILVQVSSGQLEAAVRDGWLTLVDADTASARADTASAREGAPASARSAREDGPASAREAIAKAGAVATVSAWLGASVIATRHVREIRRCLDMTESIRGTRPPAWAVRGLG